MRPEIRRVRGQYRKAVANCGGPDDEIESPERYASSERADEVRVHARDFEVERQRAKQPENCLHEGRATRPALLRVGEVYAEEKFRARGPRDETLAVCGLVRWKNRRRRGSLSSLMNTPVSMISPIRQRFRTHSTPLRARCRARTSSASRGPSRGSARTSSSSRSRATPPVGAAGTRRATTSLPRTMSNSMP